MNRSCRELLDGIRDLTPTICARALEIERSRQIPRDLLEQLRAVGVFRMLLPENYAGLGVEYTSSIEVLIESAAADGSTGWTVMIGSHAPLLLSQFSASTFDRIYAQGPDVITAGSSAPAGKLERVGKGFRVSGRWPFATGCQHAQYLFGVCTEKREEAPQASAQPPIPRLVVLPAACWQIVDTWHAAGLRGTGSHDIVLTDAPAEEEYVTTIRTDGSTLRKERELSATAEQKIMHVAAVAVGIAEGALRDLTTVGCSGKRRLYATERLSESQLFQYRLGHADAQVRASRAYLRDLAAELWKQMQRADVESSFITRALQGAAWIVESCSCAVDDCFKAAGAGAIYESSPLQRRLRDIHTLAQHVLVQEAYFKAAGASRLGQPTGVAFAR